MTNKNSASKKNDEDSIVGVVIITHGNVAEALLASAELIAGPFKKGVAVSVDSKKGVDRALKDIRQAIERVDSGSGVLILTDMFGGSSSNLSLSFLSEKRIAVVTGVNLPMLIKLSSYRQGHSLEEIKETSCTYGREKIIIASDLLNKNHL